VVDRDLILAKAGSVKKHLNRIVEKREIDLRDLNDFLIVILQKVGLTNSLFSPPD